MKATFLESNSLVRNFRRLTSKCTQLDIAMAYVTTAGLKKLTKDIENLAVKGGQIRIVFGLSPNLRITEKVAVARLLELSQNKKIEIRKIDKSGFHPKLFIFHGSDSIIIGSSNITGSGLQKNAEANIMIEQSDPKLFLDSLYFFEKYFQAGKILTSKHIDEYPSRSHEKGNGKSYPEKDYLPPPNMEKQELPQKPTHIWNISPNYQGRDWPEWFEEINENNEGYVAIGWDIGDMSDYSLDKIREKVDAYAAQRYKKYGKKTKKGYVINQLWTFKNFNIGDVLIIYSRQRIFGIAEVTNESKYTYNGNLKITYENQMNVRYLFYDERPQRADNYIVRNFGKQGTIKPVINKIWNYIYKQYCTRAR